MGRPRLDIGTYGEIRTYERGGGWIARTNFRDYDGVTRPVERTGSTENAAKANLKRALQDRSRSRQGSLTGDSKFKEAAELWFRSFEAKIEGGARATGSGELYRRQLDNHVIPGLGAFHLYEVDTPRVDDFLSAVRDNVGSPTAKSCRAVVSSVLSFAVRKGALDVNSAREAEQVTQVRVRKPRSLTKAERESWIARLESDREATRKDLPDLTRFMLATGVRIGEVLAVSWDEIDLDTGNDLIPGTVEIAWKLERVRSKGLRRVPTLKSDAGERLLPLPPFAVTMLRRRRNLVALDRDISQGTAVPVFPHSGGAGWRDPNNTRRDLRNARGAEDFAWVTSHVFRKTCATILDEAGLTARTIADQLGHARPSMTQDVYMGRGLVNPANAQALQAALDTESRGKA